MQQVVDAVPLVPLLDDPVPQMVDTVLEFFRALDLPIGEQVIAVPQISTNRVSQRLVERRLPQMVEQLVEVPTVVSYSSLLQREAKKKEEEKMEKRVAKHTAAQSEAAETMQRARLLLEQAGQEEKEEEKEEEEAAQGFLLSLLVCLSRCSHPGISGRSSTCPLHLAVLFGVMVLPEEYFGAFPYSAIPWFYYGYSTCVSRWCFWLSFHIFLCEGGPRLQRSILAATCPHGCLQARDAPHLGRYDQKDSYLARVWQCHVQGLFCWFLHLVLYSSRCSQAHDALHHGRYGPEGQLFGESLAVACTMLGFSGVSAPRAVCPVFDDVPRAVFPSLSSGPRCPSSWPAWTTGQMEVHRCSSWTRFSTCPLLCYVWCHGPDSAVHCLAVPQFLFITVISSPSWRRGLPHGSDCSADH